MELNIKSECLSFVSIYGSFGVAQIVPKLGEMLLDKSVKLGKLSENQKVTKLNAKPSIVYPIIRLPKTDADKIGKPAEIFETKHGNKQALLVTFGEL